MTPCMALGDKKILPEGYWGLKHTLDGQKQDDRGPGNWGGGSWFAGSWQPGHITGASGGI